jgi:transposase
MGAGSIAISDSSGEEYIIPTRRPDKFWRKNIQSLEERVKKCKKGSRAYNRRMKARRNMHNKSGAQHTDHQRKLAYSLVKGVHVIVIGKMHTRLGLAQSSGTHDQHWGAQNTGYHMRLLLFIKEKAAERGVHVIELPDPKREGQLNDALMKHRATQLLLENGCKKFGICPEAVTLTLDIFFIYANLISEFINSQH